MVISSHYQPDIPLYSLLPTTILLYPLLQGTPWLRRHQCASSLSHGRKALILWVLPGSHFSPHWSSIPNWECNIN